MTDLRLTTTNSGATRRRQHRSTGAIAMAGLLTSMALLPGMSPAGADASSGSDVPVLADYTPVKASVPPAEGDDYRYDTTTGYFSVIGLQSPLSGDVNLTLYDDPDHDKLLATSVLRFARPEFITVDSNHRPLGDYYPLVSPVRGIGKYVIELGQGKDQLVDTPQKIKLGMTSFIVVRDTFLLKDVTYTFTAKPGSSGQDPGLFLMSSIAGLSSTWVKNRQQSTVSADEAGPGVTETFTFTPTIADWYGIVLLNNAGSGKITLSRTT